ncbi:MAG: hypothetical protein LBB08_01615 [Rickettsiales bacterium]|jgi:hypothetical protein|nr:hypothetical protein [Rickettsiales bacterium]
MKNIRMKTILLCLLPVGAFAAEKCDQSGMYVIIGSSENCPSGYKLLGEVHDSCPSGYKEYGTIDTLAFVQTGSDEKGTYVCK